MRQPFARIVAVIAVLLSLNACVSSLKLAAINNEVDAESNAEIVVLRPSVFATAIRSHVYSDHEYIGYLGPKSYIAWEVSPGAHDIGSSIENYHWVRVNAKPGETIYLRQALGLGMLQPSVRLEPMDAIKAEEKLSNMKPPALTARLKGRGHRKSRKMKAQRALDGYQ